MFESFSYENRKKQRAYLVKYIYKHLKNTKIPKEILAFTIKSLHFSIFNLIIILCFYGPKFLALSGIIFSAMFVPLYIYFDGCFVSILEYKLLKKNFVNVIDPYLVLIGYEINEPNRRFFTIILVIWYFFVCITTFLYRFKKN